MRKSKEVRVLGCLCCVLAATALTTQAALCQFEISWYGDYNAQIWLHDEGSFLTPVSALQAKWVGGDPIPSQHPSQFTTFCLDARYILCEPAFWQEGTFPNPNSGSPPVWQPDGIYRAASLYRAYAPLVDFTTADGKLAGAALQLAIWEVLYETGGAYTVNEQAGDGFYVTGGYSAMRAMADNFLQSGANFADSSLTTSFWNAILDANGKPLERNQDLIGPPLPEPSTYIAGALLIVPLLVSTLRIKS